MGQFSLFDSPDEPQPQKEPEPQQDASPPHEAAPALAASEPAAAFWTDVKLDWYMGKISAVVRTNQPGYVPERYLEFPSKEMALEVYGVSRREDDHEITVWFGDRKLTEEAP